MAGAVDYLAPGQEKNKNCRQPGQNDATHKSEINASMVFKQSLCTILNIHDNLINFST